MNEETEIDGLASWIPASFIDAGIFLRFYGHGISTNLV